MIELIQELFLSQWIVILVLGGVFFAFSVYALRIRSEGLGYALGWLLGIFFMIVYSSLGGINREPQQIDTYLNIFQVFLPTLCGLFMGVGLMIVVALSSGNRDRVRSLLIAFLTALNLALLFLVIVEGRITQRMIGIFALAFFIAALFARIFTGEELGGGDRQGDRGGEDDYNAQQADTPRRSSQSRLDNIRRNVGGDNRFD